MNIAITPIDRVLSHGIWTWINNFTQAEGIGITLVDGNLIFTNNSHGRQNIVNIGCNLVADAHLTFSNSESDRIVPIICVGVSGVQGSAGGIAITKVPSDGIVIQVILLSEATIELNSLSFLALDKEERTGFDILRWDILDGNKFSYSCTVVLICYS